MQNRITFGGLVATLAVLLGVVGTGFAQVEVTECGQVVPARQTGVLMVDLDCPVEAGSAVVTLEERASLEMNGHTISGGWQGVQVLGRRGTIRGPGQIVAGDWEGTGRRIVFERRLEINDVTVDGGAWEGIANRYGNLGYLLATNVTVNNVRDYGVFVGKLKGSNLTANGNGFTGFNVARLKATDITANGNGHYGISAGRIGRSTNITANGNARDGIWTNRGIRSCRNVTASGNGEAGVLSYKTSTMIGFTATGNAGPGYSSHLAGVRLIDATLSGNDTAGHGIDILTARPPRLVNTVCDLSENSETGESWGVCSLD